MNEALLVLSCGISTVFSSGIPGGAPGGAIPGPPAGPGGGGGGGAFPLLMRAVATSLAPFGCCTLVREEFHWRIFSSCCLLPRVCGKLLQFVRKFGDILRTLNCLLTSPIVVLDCASFSVCVMALRLH